MEVEELKERLRGVFTTTVTPFKEDLSLDEDGIRENIRYLVKNGVDAIFPAGSIGEFSSLTFEEYSRLIRISVEEAGGKIPVIAGASSSSTHEAVKRAQEAEKLGADGILLLPPFYFRGDPEGRYRHFKMVSESVKIGVVLYNSPDFIRFSIPVGELKEVASRIKNVVGIKQSTPDMLELAETFRELRDATAVYTGHEPYCFFGLTLGCPGVFTSLSNVAPQAMKALYLSLVEGDLMRAREIYNVLMEYFSLRQRIGKPVAVVKNAMISAEINIKPYVRPPLSGISDEERRKVEVVVKKLLSIKPT